MSDLNRFSLFRDCGDKDQALLERLLVIETHSRGHVFMREGDNAASVTSALYLILEGTVDVSAAKPEGGFAVKRTMGDGDMFGMVALLGEGKRTATVTATSTVKTAKLDKRTFNELFNRDVGLHARFQLMVARQLAEDIRTLRDLLTRAIQSGDTAPIGERYG